MLTACTTCGASQQVGKCKELAYMCRLFAEPITFISSKIFDASASWSASVSEDSVEGAGSADLAM